MSIRWYRSKFVIVFFHVLAWLALFSLPVLFHRDPDQSRINWRLVLNSRSLVFDSCCIIFFYLNSLLLIPRFLNRKKIGIYVLSIVLLFGVLLTIIDFYGKGAVRTNNQAAEPPKTAPLPNKGFQREYLFVIFPYLFIWAMSTVYWFVTNKIQTDQLLKEKENENLKTELSFLRSQVSPHFLFNVLNNMVAMARLKSDLLEPSLIRLSGLMRYMLYESDEVSVTLARETEYVNSYIELQRIRYAKNFVVAYIGAGDNQRIEPMLLIPFIENAFKHGTGAIDDPVIEISLKISEGLIDFRVNNKYDPQSTVVGDRTSGIGLPNVIRRLNLLYDQKHILTIRKENGWFSVSLQIKLH